MARLKASETRVTGGRLLLTAVMLLAFLLQSYATQTHIHGAFHASPVLAAGVHLSTPSPASPSDQDEGQCQLCQAFLSGGKFLLPVAVLPVPLGVAAFTGIVFPMAFTVGRPVQGWQGRGPPAA